MSIAELKLSAKLELLYALLKDTNSTYYPMDLKAYVNSIDEAILQVKTGKFSTVNELEKESERW